MVVFLALSPEGTIIHLIVGWTFHERVRMYASTHVWKSNNNNSNDKKAKDSNKKLRKKQNIKK